MRTDSITASSQWQALLQHAEIMQLTSLKSLFAENAQRFKNYSLNACGISLDYSNTHCNQKTLSLLLDLARSVKLDQAIDDLLTGKPVNTSEQSPALHTALRNLSDNECMIEGDHDILADIRKNQVEMACFAESLQQDTRAKKIKSIVHIGIGGSKLGPEMVLKALTGICPRVSDLSFHFAANLDKSDIRQTLRQCKPETTLFIVCSKSFTTRETLANLQHAIGWMREAGFDASSISKQLVAVSAVDVNPVCRQLLQDETITVKTFPIWRWVSGRYSLWSAVGLTIVLAFGMPVFKSLLKGAHAMDRHFASADFSSNLPVILGLLGIWYNNFFAYNTQVIIPYCQSLALLPDYLQQLHMESLGKSVSATGRPLDYLTGGFLWGGVGTNSQHSFHQLLLQGTVIAPVDFILPLKLASSEFDQQEEIIANCLAQSEVLSFGCQTTGDNTLQYNISGNRPHNLLLMETLQPETLGALLALYEHKVYVQSVVWQINAFDQWGIQRGKLLAKEILQSLRETASENLRLKKISEEIYG